MSSISQAPARSADSQADDPFRVWLGVEKTDKSNAYDLLGLEPLESNVSRIRAAISRVRLMLDTVRARADVELWEATHAEVEAAIAKLQSVGEKRILDACIRRKQGLARNNARGVPATAPSELACGHCQRTGPGRRRYCSHCGQSLWQTCIRCDADVPTSEMYCGSCGTHVAEAIREETESATRRLEQAKMLGDAHRYAEAISVLQTVAQEENPRLDGHAERALARIKECQGLHASWERKAEFTHQQAREYFEATDYAAAATALRAVPEAYRSPPMAQLLDDAVARQDQWHAIARKVRDAVDQRHDLSDIAVLVDEALVLKPDHMPFQKLAQQVGERLVTQAEKLLQGHAYSSCLSLLERVPARAQGSEKARQLIDRARELDWLLQDLKAAPVVDGPLVAIAERLLRAAPDHAFATRIHGEIRRRVEAAGNSPLRAAPPWAPAPRTTQFGFPIDIWSGAGLAGCESLPVEHPVGRFVAAIGLALQALELAAVSLNLAEPERAGMLAGLTSLVGKKRPRVAWGLDLGVSSLKAVRVARDARDQARIEGAWLISYGRPLYSPEIDAKRSEILLRALKELLAVCPIAQDDCVAVNLPAHNVLGRFLEMPVKLDRKRLAETVGLEATRQIPFPLDELNWKFAATDPAANDGLSGPVLLLAARRNHVQERIELLKAAGIRTHVIQGDCVAIHNALVHESTRGGSATAAADGATAVLDVGAESTNLVVTHPTRIWFRSFPVGGSTFTNAVVRDMKLTHEDAEQVKREPQRARRIHQLYESLTPAMDQLTREIERSVEAYAASTRAEPVRQLYGVGGGFQLHGLLRHLRQAN